jgi:hypothetical protein
LPRKILCPREAELLNGQLVMLIRDDNINPCPGGGRKSGLSVAVRVTIQIEDALFFEARYVRR